MADREVDGPVEDVAASEPQDDADPEERPEPAAETVAEHPAAASSAAEDPAAEDAPVRRAAKKGRGRSSVPTWDEIMFGGGRGD